MDIEFIGKEYSIAISEEDGLIRFLTYIYSYTKYLINHPLPATLPDKLRQCKNSEEIDNVIQDYFYFVIHPQQHFI